MSEFRENLEKAYDDILSKVGKTREESLEEATKQREVTHNIAGEEAIKLIDELIKKFDNVDSRVAYALFYISSYYFALSISLSFMKVKELMQEHDVDLEDIKKSHYQEFLSSSDFYLEAFLKEEEESTDGVCKDS